MNEQLKELLEKMFLTTLPLEHLQKPHHKLSNHDQLPFPDGIFVTQAKFSESCVNGIMEDAVFASVFSPSSRVTLNHSAGCRQSSFACIAES